MERLGRGPDDVIALKLVFILDAPGFLRRDEFPTGGPWRLLLQLDSTKVLFHVNFEDAGVGYAFISGDGVSGKFLWQCC